MVKTLIVLIALTLASCATPTRSPGPRGDCHNPQDCRVEVSVVDCLLGKCAQVSVDELDLHGINVFWELDPKAIAKGYRFNQNYGIFFKLGQDNFRCQVEGDGRMYKCQPTVKPTGERYPYGVQIVGPSFVWLLDPWIVN